MSSGWRTTTLGELERESDGVIQTGPFGSQLHASDYSDVGTPVVMPTNIHDLRISTDGIARVSREHVERLNRHKLQPGDIVYSRRGDVEKCALVTDLENGWLCGTGCLLVRVGGSTVDARCLAYALSLPSTRDWISQHAVGATMPNLNTGVLREVPVCLPPIAQQRAIAATLGALDERVECNRQVVSKALNLARALYESSLAQGTRTAKVNDVAEFHNRRRAPLSSRERDQRPGTVPYYGATGVFGYVDEALFDEILLLVGEDGSVVREDGGPVLQYVWGKAWINNHAHPLTGVDVSTELLFLALDRADIRPIMTGAVQAKISMGNLKSLALDFPVGRAREELEDVLVRIFGLYRSRIDESAQLKKVRSALLPELLSGRVRIPVEVD